MPFPISHSVSRVAPPASYPAGATSRLSRRWRFSPEYLAKFPLSYRRPTGRLCAPKAGTTEEASYGTSHLCGSRPSRRGPADSITGNRLAGPDHRGAGGRPAALRHGTFRAGRPHPLAHPPARFRRSPSLRALAGCRTGAARCAKSGPATWSLFRPAKSIGMAPARTTFMVHVAMQEALDGSMSSGSSR